MIKTYQHAPVIMQAIQFFNTTECIEDIKILFGFSLVEIKENYGSFVLLGYKKRADNVEYVSTEKVVWERSDYLALVNDSMVVFEKKEIIAKYTEVVELKI